MRRVLEQTYQVAIVYAMQPRSWLQFATFLMMAFFGLGGLSHGYWGAIWMYCMLPAVFFNQQLVMQFTHYRARITPGFRLPHILPAAIFCVAFLCLLPLVVAVLNGQPILKSLALCSGCFAICLFLCRRTTFSWILLAVLIGPGFFGYSVFDVQLDFAPVAFATITLVAWLLITLHFNWLAKLNEDTPDFARLRRAVESAMPSSAHGGSHRPGTAYSMTSRWPQVTDWWLDRGPGFHNFRPVQIIRLLRRGIGPIPTEIWAIPVATVVACLLLYAGNKIEETSDWINIWFLGALYATLLPGAQAGVELGNRLPLLALESTRPLSRHQLINGLLLTAAWNAASVWLISNLAILIVILIVPGSPATLPVALTYLLLSASIAVVMFGLALFDVRFVSTAERLVALLFVLAICVGVLVWWWMGRTQSGDAPFWILACLLLASGAALIRSARTYWLNLELASASRSISPM